MPDAKDAIARFGVKQGDFASLAPTVILPVVGAALGGRMGKQIGGYGAIGAGRFLGGIGGGLGGLALREHALPTPTPGGERVDPEDLIQRDGPPLELYRPPGTGYTIDDSVYDIPAWARRGAQVLKEAGLLNWVLGQQQLTERTTALGGTIGVVKGSRAFTGY